MTIGDKIKMLRESKGLTQGDLAKFINSTKQTIFKYETGIVTNIPMDKLTKIAAALGCSPAFLLGWSEAEAHYKEGISKMGGFEIDMNSNLRPVFASIVAGVPMEAQTDIVDRIPIHRPNPDQYFGVRVKGRSMIEAGIPDGCTAIFRSQPTADNGQIVAACINGETTLKKFMQVDNTIFLIPANSEFVPIVVKEDDDFSIYGVLVEISVKFE